MRSEGSVQLCAQMSSSRLRSTRRSALAAGLDGADLKVGTSDSTVTNEDHQTDQSPLTLHTYRKKSKVSFGYEDYLTPDLLNQVSRHSNYILKIKSIEQQFDIQVPNVRSSWFYQRVVSWLYAVCDSYITTTLLQIKPLWKDISFNEFFLLEDILRCIDTGKNKEEDYNAATTADNDQRLFAKIRTKLLDQLPRGRHASNSENNEPISQDLVVNEYLTGINELQLVYDHTKVTMDSLPILTQFEILYHIIKYIESKSMIFRNYATSRPDLFKFTQLGVSKKQEQKQNEVIFALQNPFSVVIKRVIREGTPQFHIPIKLKHCTVRYEEENQLVYLDYTKEIETYLSSIQLNYEVLSYCFDGLLQLYNNSSNISKNGAGKLLMERITSGAELLIQACKVLVQREKDKLLQELLTRRKRSSRLLVREEEVRRKEVGEQLSEKLDKRQAFLKHRHRSVARLTKRCKDLLWNDLWIRFNQDVKTATRRNGKDGFNLEAVTEESSTFSSLSAADRYVLQSGDTFKEPIIKLNAGITRQEEEEEENNNELSISGQTSSTNLSPRELPTDLCITQDDISHSIELGIPLDRDITAPDNSTDWIFQCTCEPGRKLTTISMADIEEINRDKYSALGLLNGTPIICCDICSRWQHWNCQDPSVIQYVSLSAVRSVKDIPTARIFTQRDFGTVPMNLSDLDPYRSPQRPLNSEYESVSYGSTRRSTRRTRAQDSKTSNYVSPYREQSSDDNDNDDDDGNNNNATSAENTNQQEADLRPKRPTDRRTRFGECAVFMCGYCLSKYEKQLRDTFVPELELLRAKQKRQHEDRERRKLEKLRKKEEEEAQARAQAEAQNVMAVNSSVPAAVPTTQGTIPGTAVKEPVDVTTTASMVNPVVSVRDAGTTGDNQYNITTSSNGNTTTQIQTQTQTVTGESAHTDTPNTVTADRP